MNTPSMSPKDTWKRRKPIQANTANAEVMSKPLAAIVIMIASSSRKSSVQTIQSQSRLRSIFIVGRLYVNGIGVGGLGIGA